jgi:hypothetical protein
MTAPIGTQEVRAEAARLLASFYMAYGRPTPATQAMALGQCDSAVQDSRQNMPYHVSRRLMDQQLLILTQPSATAGQLLVTRAMHYVTVAAGVGDCRSVLRVVLATVPKLLASADQVLAVSPLLTQASELLLAPAATARGSTGLALTGLPPMHQWLALAGVWLTTAFTCVHRRRPIGFEPMHARVYLNAAGECLHAADETLAVLASGHQDRAAFAAMPDLKRWLALGHAAVAIMGDNVLAALPFMQFLLPVRHLGVLTIYRVPQDKVGSLLRDSERANWNMLAHTAFVANPAATPTEEFKPSPTTFPRIESSWTGLELHAMTLMAHVCVTTQDQGAWSDKGLGKKMAAVWQSHLQRHLGTPTPDTVYRQQFETGSASAVVPPVAWTLFGGGDLTAFAACAKVCDAHMSLNRGEVASVGNSLGALQSLESYVGRVSLFLWLTFCFRCVAVVYVCARLNGPTCLCLLCVVLDSFPGCCPPFSGLKRHCAVWQPWILSTPPLPPLLPRRLLPLLPLLHLLPPPPRPPPPLLLQYLLLHLPRPSSCSNTWPPRFIS